MISPEEYRKKYEGGNMTGHEELVYLKEENRRLREAFNAARAFIEANKDDDNIVEIYERYVKAKKALNQ